MIKLLESIEMQTALPIDKRSVVETLTERDAINKAVRYIGMEVYVVKEQKKFQLKKGITNSDWEELRAVAKASELVTDPEHLTVSEEEKKLWNSKSSSNHKHSKAEISDFPVALKNPNVLKVKIGNGKEEEYDGSSTKEIDISLETLGAQPKGEYALKEHNHEKEYAPLKHNHNKEYAPTTHKHKADDIATDEKKLFVSIEEKDKWNTKADGDHKHDDVYAKFEHIHLPEEIKENENKKFISEEKLNLLETLANGLCKNVTFSSGEVGTFSDGEKNKVYKCLYGTKFPEYPAINPEFSSLFCGWKIEPIESSFDNSVVRDTVITALYQKPIYTITFKCNKGGVFKENGKDTIEKRFQVGDKITPIPEIAVDNSYEFLKWEPALTEDLVAKENATYTADFKFLGINMEIDDSAALFVKKVVRNDDYTPIKYPQTTHFHNDPIILSR